MILLFLFIVIGVLITVKTIIDTRNSVVMREKDLLLMTDQRLSSLVLEINNFPRGPGQDVLFLSNITSLKDFSADPQEKDLKDKVSADLDSYLNQSEAFYSIVYLDLKSGESIYLNQYGRNDMSVDSYLFKEIESVIRITGSLDKGMVHLSNAHRHEEFGEIITAIEYATPVFSSNNERIGVINLTVNINYILEDVRNYSKPNEDVFLIDSNGVYLSNQNPVKEFIEGSMEGYGSFIDDYPGTAKNILMTGNRRMESDEHIFSIRHIYPAASGFEFYNEEAGRIYEYPYHWMLISVLEKDDGKEEISTNYYFLGVVLLLLCLGIITTHKSSLSKRKAFLVAAILLFSLSGKAEAMTVDVYIPEKYKDMTAGERLYFEVDIKYPENTTRRDIRLEYNILKDNEIIAKTKSLKAVETQASFMDYIVVPEFAKAGEYKIKTIISNGTSVEGETMFSVKEKNFEIKLIFYVIIGLIGFLSVIIGWEVIKLGKIKK